MGLMCESGVNYRMREESMDATVCGIYVLEKTIVIQGV